MTISTPDRLHALQIVTTEVAAKIINRKPQTLRKWACLKCGPIEPVNINRRLGWRVADLEMLIQRAEERQ